MIRWSFWVDAWEHPFNTWNRFYSVLIPLASVEPGLVEIDPLPPKEHVDYGPWKGPPPGPIKPGTPKVVIDWEAQRLAAEGTAEYWWLDPRFAEKYAGRGAQEGERPDDREHDRPQEYRGGEPEEERYWAIGPYTDETVPQQVKYV
jgi:hypothetical protein